MYIIHKDKLIYTNIILKGNMFRSLAMTMNRVYRQRT